MPASTTEITMVAENTEEPMMSAKILFQITSRLKLLKPKMIPIITIKGHKFYKPNGYIQFFG